MIQVLFSKRLKVVLLASVSTIVLVLIVLFSASLADQRSDDRIEDVLYRGMTFAELRKVLGSRGDYNSDLEKLREAEYFWSYGRISPLPFVSSRTYSFRFDSNLRLNAVAKKLKSLFGDEQFFDLL